MKLERRKYEDNAVATLRTALLRDRVLAVAPTGSGKTVIAALLLKRESRWDKVLFLAHRHELINQAHDHFKGLGLEVGIMMAQDEKLYGPERVDPGARVQIGSVQTLGRRGVPSNVDLVIFDEAHRSMADSYQRIAKACPKAEVLGLTATPCRMDGRGLGEFFTKLLVMAQPSELQELGYLAMPKTWTASDGALIKLKGRLKGAATSKGDYTPAALAKAVDSKFLVGHVVDETLRIAPKVRKVVFAGSIKHSRAIVNDFVARGVKAEHLDGNTPADERKAILERLSGGATEAVSNVDVLSEGWDLPALGAVVIARPTKSKARWLQMVGRGMRPYKGRVPIVIDHGANFHRFELQPGADIEWSLEEGAKRKAGEVAMRTCPSCHAVIWSGLAECPECGEALPKTEREIRQEVEAELEELTKTRMAEIRARLEVLAKQKGAPAGWVERVISCEP